ncbi:MAG: hypothetical protein M5R41_11290 [Bacteroidia bacterium]|nr:hypothetical protein [Bacteroidia bacterium]
MKFVLYFTWAVLAIIEPCAAQKGAPSLNTADIPGWSIEQPDRYNDKQLFGYINGGAELYLEYGFRMVTAWRCQKGKQEFVADVYEMATPAAAFGMWSISRRNCTSTLDGAMWSCVTSNQILFTRGSVLVNITIYDKSEESRSAARKAAVALLKRIEGKDFMPPEVFTTGALSRQKNELRLMQGPLAIQGSLADWSGLLEGIARCDVFHTRSGAGKSATDVGMLRFRSPRDVDTFIAAAGFRKEDVRKKWNVNAGKKRALKLSDATTVWFLEGGNDIERLVKIL